MTRLRDPANQEEPLLETRNLTKVYPAPRGGPPPSAAAKNVSLQVGHGECLGIVGESGSGKTTVANCLVGLLAPSDGVVLFRGEIVNQAGEKLSVPRVHGVQVVFQDPATSLHPRRSIGSVLAEILSVHHIVKRAEISERIDQLLAKVGLLPDVKDSRPSRLSGGQQQRVAIARALAFEPAVIVADEIVSSLDASVQAQILNLLSDLREELGMSIVLITHDIAVARHLCDRLAVMQEAVIVETGETEALIATPEDPYTQALFAAVPRLASS